MYVLIEHGHFPLLLVSASFSCPGVFAVVVKTCSYHMENIKRTDLLRTILSFFITKDILLKNAAVNVFLVGIYKISSVHEVR